MKVPWYVWLGWALAFVVFEGIALFNHVANDTLTQTVAHHVPGWIVASFLGWLTYHFTVTYINRRDGK